MSIGEGVHGRQVAYTPRAAHSDNLAQRPGTMARMEAHYIFAIAAMALAMFCSQATAAMPLQLYHCSQATAIVGF